MYKKKPVKIIFVHFLNGRKNYFFGSISAVFQNFSEQDLGCSEEYLRHVLTTDGSSHLSQRAYFYRSRLISYSSRSKAHDTAADNE